MKQKNRYKVSASHLYPGQKTTGQPYSAFPFPKAVRICSTKFYSALQKSRHSQNDCILFMPSTKAKAEANVVLSKRSNGLIRFVHVMWLQRTSLRGRMQSSACAHLPSSLILFFAIRAM